MSFTFTPAVRTKTKARVGIIGPTGSGKTLTALYIARGLAGPEGRIAVIDSENGKAALYAGEVAFDHLALESFSPVTYVEAIHAAEAAGYDVVVVDSLSHAWMGKDGALEQVDKTAKRYQGNTFAAWREVTPKHNDLVDALVRCKAHLVATMRAKTEYVLEDDGRGKKVPRKVGLAPIQRDGMEYEFDIVADMDQEHSFIVSKTRYRGLDNAVINKPGVELGEQIRAWLEEGVDAPPAPPATIQSRPSLPGQQKTQRSAKERIAELIDRAQVAGLDQNAIKAVWRSATGKDTMRGCTQADLDAFEALLAEYEPDGMDDLDGGESAEQAETVPA